MPRKRYSTPTDTFAAPELTTRLPVERPIAVYYRQSTDAQVGNLSTTIQTIDMVAYLTRCGWQEKNVILIDMDEGVSGSKKIDERPGMSMLFALITEGKIGAVACQDEDRLFRDVTQIQVNIFIEACRASRVLVLTPSMVYDFANEHVGSFHARQFRFKCEMAAEYISSVIRGKLHRAKRRLLLDGCWAGAGVPPGFMVDMRKALPDGSRNPQWRKFVLFPLYAQVVNEYFRLFLANAGSVRATVRHIQHHGPYYPDPAITRPPEGFKFVCRMRRYGNGYCPGRTGLAELLTNVAYIGHWMVSGVVVKWNNHQPIVPIEVFEAAFNYLSKVLPDGMPNPHFRAFQEQARPSTEAERGIDRPLCAGMIVSLENGEWRRVGTYWVKPLKHYTYNFLTRAPVDEYGWSRKAEVIDEAIVSALREKLSATFEPSVWQQTLAVYNESYEQERNLRRAQLSSLEQVMENLVVSLDTLTNSDMIRAAETRYEAAKSEHVRLLQELAKRDDLARRLEAIYSLKDSCGPALENWPNLKRNSKRVVLQAFIKRIEATPIGESGLRLTIYWRDGNSDEMTLATQASTYRFWLPDEEKWLTALLEDGCRPLEIARAFPDRSWGSLRQKIKSLTGNGSFGKKRAGPMIRRYETYNDFIERTGGDALATIESGVHSGTTRRDAPG